MNNEIGDALPVIHLKTERRSTHPWIFQKMVDKPAVRPKPGAPVSTPLNWEELTEDITPRDFSMQVALDRIAQHGDLFEPVLHARQALGPALKALRS